MKRILLPFIIILLMSGNTAWAGGLFPGTSGVSDAKDVKFDNTEASISGNPTNVKTAIDGLKTEIGNISAGGLADIDDLPGDTFNDNKIDSSLINNAAADGSTKGVCTFSASHFSAASGVISLNTTLDLSAFTITFGLEDADIPASIARDSELPTATTLHLDDVLTALGIESEDVHFGTFTGSTIGDNLTAKAIFQALETAIESIEGGSVTTSSPIGATAFTDLAAGNTYTNYGDADDDTINELFAAIDASWPSGSGAPTDASYLTAGANATLSNERVVSADGLSLIQAADFAAMQELMGVQASDSSLTNIAARWTVDSSGNVSGIGTIEPTPTTHPQAVLYDSDAPGSTTAEKAMAYLWGEYVDGADDAENSSAGIAARAAGAWADWIKYLAGAVYIYHDLDVDGDVTADNFGDGTTPVRIVHDPTPATDATVSGDLISVVTTTGLNAVAGDLVCVVAAGGTDGPIVALADADHADKVGAVFLITESISAENAGKALISGIMRLDSWDWSGANKALYISATAGDMTETVPSGSGNQVQKVGYSLTPDTVMFRPSVDIGEVP